eukprot:scaffold291_cov168-Amphora_coffeaeformis.AAC.6
MNYYYLCKRRTLTYTLSSCCSCTRPVTRTGSFVLGRSLTTLGSSSSSSSSIIREEENDFAHHAPGVARLNHASFGAVPKPVLDAQRAFQQEWLSQPDELYFSGRLHDRMRQAARAGATTLTTTTTSTTTTATTTTTTTSHPLELPPEQVCLFENATVATCAVAYHWSKSIQPGDVVVYLDVAYKACVHILKEYCERQGARLVPLSVPFPATTAHDIVTCIRQQLQDLADRGVRPRFAFMDHVSSQPCILLPLVDLIAAVREYGVEQVCVDGAHAVGSVPPFDVRTLDCDYYYSNLHKWAFAPSTATIFWSPHAPDMRHPITSWAWGEGLAQETLFPGTRDFSAMAAVPAAVHRGVRDRLREEYHIEAAVGNFGEKGNFLRLSFAVYNNQSEIERLAQAILEIEKSQE